MQTSNLKPHNILVSGAFHFSKTKVQMADFVSWGKFDILKGSSIQSVFRAEIWLTVCRSIYIRMQEDIHSYWACALKMFFLPCDPAGNINSLYNEKVYRSECSFIYMNEMCMNIKPGAS